MSASFSLPVEPASCLFCEDCEPQAIARGRDYEYDTTPDFFAMDQCSGCGLVFVQPRPTSEAMSVIYPSNYYAYNEGEGENAFIKRFRDRVEQGKVRRYEALIGKTHASLCDIGCGDGRLLEILRRVGPDGWKLAGIELGEGAAARAAAKGFPVKSGDFESLDVDDWADRFDLALMHHVIEHVRDPRAAVRKLAGMLKPGGLASIETPETCGWDFSLFRRRYWGGYHIPRHFYLFDKETLCRLLREEGFEIVSARSILSPAFWIWSWHNWLVDRAWGRPLARFVHPQNFLAVSAATLLEILQGVLRGQSTNLQVLARRSKT